MNEFRWGWLLKWLQWLWGWRAGGRSHYLRSEMGSIPSLPSLCCSARFPDCRRRRRGAAAAAAAAGVGVASGRWAGPGWRWAAPTCRAERGRKFPAGGGVFHGEEAGNTSRPRRKRRWRKVRRRASKAGPNAGRPTRVGGCKTKRRRRRSCRHNMQLNRMAAVTVPSHWL